MAKSMALFLAALFAGALALPGAADAGGRGCAGLQSVQSAPVTIVDGGGTAPITPIPETKTGG
ncbi:MAG TPA: hypothetical protein VJJ77_09455 [Dongiaceae bacterium]|nr:hypothetical protein [Dongiaceae bacterium]